MLQCKKIITILSLGLLLTSCGKEEVKEEKVITRTADLIENINENSKSKEEQDNQVEDKNSDISKFKNKSDEPISKSQSITIKAGGDIMANFGQTQYAYNKGGGTYDFSDSFMYVKDFIKDADLSIANYETTTNPNKEYSGHPRFNVPSEYLEAIADAGFDVLTTANNHSLDTEIEGVFTTIDAIEKAGIDHVGTHEAEGPRYIIKDVDGIKVAILSYTYGCNGIENLFIVREEIPEINYLNESEIKKDIESAKNEGADFVLVYPHWGIELRSDADISQTDLGHKMVEWGADLVIGNHPHVVEPYEWYQAENGNKGFIAYACGNFISIQNLETVNDIRTEQSVAYEIKLSKEFPSGKTSIDDVSAHPLWVGMTYNDYGRSVRTYLCEDFLDGGKYYNEVEEYQRNRIKTADESTRNTLVQMENK